jgi:hypothetical protein
MKNNLIYSVVIMAGLLFTGALGFAQEPVKEKPVSEQQMTQYTCTMHPEVVQDKPGNCPVCGMKLVEKKNGQEGKECHTGKSLAAEHHEHKTCNDTTMMHHEHKTCNDTTKMHHGHMMD